MSLAAARQGRSLGIGPFPCLSGSKRATSATPLTLLLVNKSAAGVPWTPAAECNMLSELYVRQVTGSVLASRLVWREDGMTQEKQLEELLHEFERVGVDPNTISAGLAVPRAEVMRVLRSLPDCAGPAAFLTQLRLLTTSGSGNAGADGRSAGAEDRA